MLDVFLLVLRPPRFELKTVLHLKREPLAFIQPLAFISLCKIFANNSFRYYLLYPNAGNTTLSAFPANFHMIAGNTNFRNFSYPVPDIQKSLWYQAPYNTQAFLEQAAVGFNCLNYGKTPEGSLYRHFLPDKAYLDANCADGIRLELMFPSCWDGQTFDVKDQREHVAYPSEVMTGDCPSGYPLRLPSLFYETIWATNSFVGKSGQFMLSNGDPTGISSPLLHEHLTDPS